MENNKEVYLSEYKNIDEIIKNYDIYRIGLDKNTKQPIQFFIRKEKVDEETMHVSIVSIIHQSYFLFNLYLDIYKGKNKIIDYNCDFDPYHVSLRKLNDEIFNKDNYIQEQQKEN